MPYKSERLKIKLPKEKWKDRRYKLTPRDRLDIRKNKDWLTQSALADKYWVHRSTIKYTQNPVVYEKLLASYKERRKDGRYYDRVKQREAWAKTREWRFKVIAWGERWKILDEFIKV